MLPPRMDPVEIEFFEQLLRNKVPGTKMVEWGSGGSTTMFLPYFETGQLISIEHNEEWFDRVMADIGSGEYLDAALANFLYCHIPPSHLGQPVPKAFYGYGIPQEENPCFAKAYIDPSPGTNIWDADIFFVDGICRGAILATIRMKAQKPDAVVLIHDYYGPENRQSWYEWASSMYHSVIPIGTTLARLTI